MAALPPVLLGLVIMGLAGLPLMAAHRRLRSKRSRLTAGVTERLPHAGELLLLGSLAKESAQIQLNTEPMIHAVLHRHRLAVLIRVVPDVMGGCAIATLGMVVQKTRELGSVWNRYCAWATAKARCLALVTVRPPPQKRHSFAGKSVMQSAPGVYIRLARVRTTKLKGADSSARQICSCWMIQPPPWTRLAGHWCGSCCGKRKARC